MTKPLLEKHARAIELRKLGWSYPAIKSELKVSKASLSLWLHKYPLTEKQIRQLSLSRARRIEHFRETFQRKRQTTLDKIYEVEKVSLLPLSRREEYIAGLMLYWGEGLKRSWGCVSFSNTNPTFIKFAMHWLIDCCAVSAQKLKVRFHYYSDMDVEKENIYWQKILGLPLSQFRNPYIKQSLRSQIKEKGGFGHGTCDLMVYDTILKEKILMGIKVIADNIS
jgi:hypothetical protein